MPTTVNEIMSHDPRTVEETASAVEAAREMRDGDVGAVIVTAGGAVRGIVTDRDIAIRCVASGTDPGATTVGEITSAELTCLATDQSVEDAVKLMREQNVRRLPVVEHGRAVGIVSLGDLAVERDPGSALADISAAEPNR